MVDTVQSITVSCPAPASPVSPVCGRGFVVSTASQGFRYTLRSGRSLILQVWGQPVLGPKVSKTRRQ